MLGFNTPLHNSNPDRTLIEFDNTQPNNPSLRNGSKMLESCDPAIVPSFFYGTVSDNSAYNDLMPLPAQTASEAGFAPWTPCPETLKSAAEDEATYHYNGDESFTSVPSHSSFDGLDHPKPIKHEPLMQGFSSEPTLPPFYSTFPTNDSFASDHDIFKTVSTRRAVMPFPSNISGRRLCEDLEAVHISDGISAPRSRHPHDFAFDHANSNIPSPYSTASDLQTDAPSIRIHMCRDGHDTMTVGSYETDSDSARGEPPYAKLIYNALMDAPGHKLILREIYSWISDNTDKAKDPTFKGWQNSVRHNLSMNGAFMKVAYSDPGNKHKKGYIWVLDPAAVGKGIESTTRYRQKTGGKKNSNNDLVDLKRQRSGRKGGRAARKSARLRRSAKTDDHDPECACHLGGRVPGYCCSPSGEGFQSISPDMNQYNLGGLPYYVDPPSSESPHQIHSPYSYQDVTAPEAFPADRSRYSSSLDNDSDFLGSRPEDFFSSQGLPAFV